jgi:hypothetical protein
MYTTLTIGIYGMIESKKKKHTKALFTEMDSEPAAMAHSNEYEAKIKELER